MAFKIFKRGDTDHLPEGLAEVIEAAEAAADGDIGDGTIVFAAQQGISFSFFVALLEQKCYNLSVRQTADKYNCTNTQGAPRHGVEVKGKRVKVPYELVTVKGRRQSRHLASSRRATVTGRSWEGRAGIEPAVRKPALSLVPEAIPDHEQLIVPQ